MGDSELFRGLEMRCIGPYRGGRVVAVAGDVTDPRRFYFGACAGGIWKTTDGGTYWENISDGYLSTAAIGAIAVSESDPNVLYAGTGETSIRGNVSHGDGVYRSDDGGHTWRNVGLRDTRHIGRVRIHPRDPDIVYVAALGHAWGPNAERGVYRSRDGGKSWEQVLFRSDRAGAVDLSMDPTNPRILYASIWEAQRYPWALSSGGPGSGLFMSTDGGDTWSEITRNPGLPQGVIGKIGVAVSPARPGRVWALVEAHDGALFRSDDGAETWTRHSEAPELRTRAWYYTHLFADPNDADTCWVLNFLCWKSVDGGSTFTAVPNAHGDNHDLWIDPGDSRRMIQGNDGGACVTYNGGESWSTLFNQPTAQMYHVTADTRVPYRVYGSQQDNTAISLPSMSTRGAITASTWVEPGGGESGYLAVHPDDPEIVYGGAIGSGSGNGRMIRFDGHTDQERNITVWPDTQFWADGADTLKHRFQWTFPIVISPHDHTILYACANTVLRSTDEGASWEEISPDLTRNDPSKLVASGGPITKDNTGAEVYCTIFAFVESPHEAGVLWAGSDDGRVHISRDAGTTWREITPPDLPEWALISIIDVSPHDPATAYLAATRYKLDDTSPYLYRTNDYGATWTRITTGIPEDDFTRVIREDPKRRGLLFAGTETAIYVSFDDGESWQPFTTNLPAVPIHDLIVKDDDLVVATHGRSFWILDDLTPLRALDGGAPPASLTVFPPRETPRMVVHQGYSDAPAAGTNYGYAGPAVYAYRHQTMPDGTTRRILLDAGANPPYGVLLTYFLPEAPEGEVSLTVTDADGKEVRRFTTKPAEKPAVDPHASEEPIAEGTEGIEGGPAAEAPGEEERKVWLPARRGINRFAWDLRYEEPEKVKGDKSIEYAPPGPLVPPGRYTLTLRVGETEQQVEARVVRDPRIAAGDGDLEAMADLLLQVRDKLTAVNRAVKGVRDVKAQIAGWKVRAPEGETGDALRAAASTLTRKLSAVEEKLAQPETKGASALRFPRSLTMRLAALPGYGEGADAAPTAGMIDVYRELERIADDLLAQLDQLYRDDVAQFSELVTNAGLQAVTPPAP